MTPASPVETDRQTGGRAVDSKRWLIKLRALLLITFVCGSGCEVSSVVTAARHCILVLDSRPHWSNSGDGPLAAVEK